MMRALKFLVSILLLGVAASFLDLHMVLRTFKEGSPTSFVVAILINLLAVLVMGVRWGNLSASDLRRSCRAQLALYFRATFLNSFTPANLGGDAYRLTVLKGESYSGSVVLRLLLRERLLGLYGYVLVFVLAYGIVVATRGIRLDPSDNPYMYGVMVAVATLMVAALARPLGRALMAILERVVSPARVPGLVRCVEVGGGLLSSRGTLRLLGLTFAGILLWIASIKILADGFGFPVSWAELAAVATLVELVRLIPVTIQGVGLREGVFAYLIGYWGYGYEQSYVVALTAYLALRISIFLCGPVSYLFSSGERTRREEASLLSSNKEWADVKGVTKYSGMAQIYFRYLLRQVVRVGKLDRPNITILDFGCGAGKLKAMLGPKVVGYDIVPSLSDVDDWRMIDFDVLVGNEVFYSFSERDLDELLIALRAKNRHLELVVGVSRQGVLNNVGKFLLGRPDAHSATKLGPRQELGVFERHCTMVRRKNVWNLANVYSFVFN